jgi:hypothetical protein
MISETGKRSLRPDPTFDQQRQFEKQLRCSGREPRCDLIATIRPKAPFQRRADVTQLAGRRYRGRESSRELAVAGRPKALLWRQVKASGWTGIGRALFSRRRSQQRRSLSFEISGEIFCVPAKTTLASACSSSFSSAYARVVSNNR